MCIHQTTSSQSFGRRCQDVHSFRASKLGHHHHEYTTFGAHSISTARILQGYLISSATPRSQLNMFHFASNSPSLPLPMFTPTSSFVSFDVTPHNRTHTRPQSHSHSRQHHLHPPSMIDAPPKNNADLVAPTARTPAPLVVRKQLDRVSLR
jgi:hypothetical protein